MFRSYFLAFCIASSLSGMLPAQDGSPTIRVQLVDAVLQNEPPKGTLPPVEVRPPIDDLSGNPRDESEGTLPPIEIRPPQDTPTSNAVARSNQRSEQAFMFPSLSDQIIGELDSGLRGAPLSIFDSPRAIDIVTPELLQEKSPIDMGQALEQTPGVLIQRTGRGQSSIFIRGLTGQQVLIMIDGVRMTNATFRAGPNQYFNLIDPNMVERIEVIRGAGSVLYGGDAIGGVVNIVTKSANRTGYNFLTGGTVQRFSTADLGYTGRVNVEGWVGSMGVFTGGGYGNYNNLDIGGTPDAPAGFDVGRQPATSWRYQSADIKLNYQLSNCSEFVFAVQRYRGDDIFRSDRFPANRESIFGPQIRDLYYVRWQGCNPCGCGLIDSYQITASLQRFDEQRTNRDFRPGRNPLLTSMRGFVDEQTGITGSFLKNLDSYGTISYGFDWYHDEIDSFRTDIDASVAPPTVTHRAGEVPDDAYYSRYGLFLNWDVWLTDRLLASSGVRYEHVASGATVTANDVVGHIDPEYQDWIGQVGLTYELTPHLHLVGSISEGFRAPNIDDLATINDNVFIGTQLPNPNLLPETSITYEVGTKINTDRFHSQVFVWWNDLQNFIVRGAPNSELLLERTNANAYLNGVELSGEYLVGCNWSVYGNFWYTYGQNTEAREPLSRIPPMQGIFGLRRRWNFGNDWFDLFGWIVDEQDRLSARDISDVNRIPLGGTPGFATVNFRYGRMISERQRLSLNLENFFDEQYRVHGSGSDGPGINAILSYELLR
ncbi:MAG: TonB-dependent receptor [Planctomycetaceae bacterium]|nr:TonB-dependent receptor [Planctomycetaceae bacterium]